jgi:fatty-acyl-CoA synthase
MAQIADALRRVARTVPATPAIAVRGGPVLTYRLLDERTDRLANAMLGAGLRPGDTVGAWMEDGHEYFELYLAAAKAGLVVVPVNARFKAEEAQYALERADVRALFFTDGVAEMVEDALAARKVVVAATPGVQRPLGALFFEDFLAGGSATVPTVTVPDDAPMILAFTSGTTGYPKAAVLSQGSVVRVCRSQVMALRIPTRGVRAHTNSMSFTSSVTAHLMPTLYTGGLSVLMGKNWDMDDLFQVVRQFDVTHTTVPSPLVRDFVEAAESAPHQLATLQSVLHAGSKVDASLLERMGALLGGRFVEAWGMTENSGGVACATSFLDTAKFPDAAGPSSRGVAVFETVGRCRTTEKPSVNSSSNRRAWPTAISTTRRRARRRSVRTATTAVTSVR